MQTKYQLATFSLEEIQNHGLYECLGTKEGIEMRLIVNREKQGNSCFGLTLLFYVKKINKRRKTNKKRKIIRWGK